MADDITEEELRLEPQDAGLVFRAEMWLTDTLLGYWPYLVGVLVAGLGAIFFYNQYLDHVESQQRAFAEAIAKIESRLDVPVAGLAYQQAAGQPLDQEELAKAAAALEAIDAYGAGRCEADLKAAEIYRLLERPADQRRVLERVEAEGIEPFAYLATSSLANLDLEEGASERAIERLTRLMQSHQGFLGEQAALDLGMVYEHLGKQDEARQVYLQFEERWSNSPRLEQVKKRLGALKAG